MIGNNDLMKEISVMLKAHPKGATAIMQKVQQLFDLSIDNLLATPEEGAKCTLIGECRAYRDIIEMLQFALTTETEAKPSQGSGIEFDRTIPSNKGTLNIV